MTRLRVHFDAWLGSDAKGTALGELTQAKEKVYRDEPADFPSGQFKINRHDLQSSYAATGNLIRVRHAEGGPFAWDDPRYIGAFFIEEGADVLVDPGEQGGEDYERGGRGTLSYLENALVYHKAFASGSGKPAASSGYWYWNPGPYGQIMNRLMNEVRARWADQFYLVEDFGDTHDTDGGLFDSFTAQYRVDIGTTYMDVVNGLRELGMEFSADAAFGFHAWSGAHGTDRSAEVVFEKGVNIREADERDVHASTYKSRVLVRGTVGTKITYREVVHSPSLEDEVASDRREGYTEYGKTSSVGALDKVGRKFLGASLGEKEGPQTLGVTTGDGTEAGDGHYVPWVDYFPGDTVLLEVPGEYNGVAKAIGAVTILDGEDGDAETIVEFREGPFSGGGVSPPPSPDDPFVPVPTHGYKGAVIADGAIHAWAYDEASGNVLDYVDSVVGVPAVTGVNPTREVAGPPLIIGSKAWHMAQAGLGNVTVVPANEGSDFPAGNSDWSVEWHHGWDAAFFGQEIVASWGNLNTATIYTYSTFGNGHDGPAVEVVVQGVTLTDLGEGAGVCPLDTVSLDGNWHNLMVTYTGADRTYKVYLDGELQGSLVGNLDLELDPPGPTDTSRLLEFNVLEGFKFGWQSIYPSALTAAQAANHALGDGAVIAGSESDLPSHGQRVGPESWVSDGVTTSLQTMFPYAWRSLVVSINGIPVVVSETQDELQTDGRFLLPAPTAAGNVVSWYYTATGGEATGASNPLPSPSPPGVPTDPGQVLGGDGVYRPPLQPYVPAEPPDGSRVVFTIVPYVAGQATQLTIGTQAQRKDIDWRELDPAAGTIEMDEAPLVGEEITVWAMPLAATPPPGTPGSGGGPVNLNLYGTPFNFDTKANHGVGPEGDFAATFVAGTSADLDSILFQSRGGSGGYSGGTGGVYDVDVYAANSSGAPTGASLAHLSWTPGNPGGDWTDYPELTWSSPAALVAGNRYSIVWHNTGSPTNWVSVNCLFTFGTSPLPAGQGRQPFYADADYGCWEKPGSTWLVKDRFTMDMDLTYSDGHHDGVGYIQGAMETTTYSGGTHVYGLVNGPDKLVRERIVVSGGARKVVDVHVRARLNSGSAPMIVKLKQGATVLAQVSIPASAFSPATAPGFDNGGSRWGSASWAATITLPNTATIDVELSTAAGTTYSLAPVRKGTDEGFDPSLVFMDGQGEFSLDGGASWDPLYPFDTDAPNLQLYQRVTP